jgi:hypothetical protein
VDSLPEKSRQPDPGGFGEAAGWLDERRAMIANSKDLFQRLDEEEGEAAGKQWLGE